MTTNFRAVFGDTKPVIAMVHFGALPGSPLYDAEAGIDGLVAGITKDLDALQAAGFDAVMFGNENDRPYEFAVDTASTATMACAIGRVRDRIEVHGEWKFVWQDGKEVQVNGIALDRQFDPNSDTYGITDGSAGIRGKLEKTDEFLEFKLFTATAISGAARRSEDTTRTIFGSEPSNSLENAGLEGAAAVTDRYANLLMDQIEDDGLFVRVPAGTQFYVYTLQVFEPKLASGFVSLSSWSSGKRSTIAATLPSATRASVTRPAESVSRTTAR